MVDIHSHVLYGMDDGAQTFDESLAMLRMAAESGTTDIVATPHADPKFPLQPDRIASQLEQLRGQQSIPRLHRGCDFHLSFDNIESCFSSPDKYTINGLRYLMVEFSNYSIPDSLRDVFGRMIESGIQPVITHPERNPILSKDLTQVTDYVRNGCYVQVTAQSLTGRFGKTAEAIAHRMLEGHLVHFVASDAHNVEHRPPNLRPAFELTERMYGAATAEALFIHNPAAALTGAELPAANRHVTKRSGWFKLRR